MKKKNKNLTKSLIWKFKIILMIGLLFFNLQISFAQILNVDKITSIPDSATKKLHILLNFGLEVDGQETAVIDAKSTLDISYFIQKNVFIFVTKFDETMTGEKKVLNAGYSHLRLRLAEPKQIRPEFYTQYQWDGVRGLKGRFLTGANVRFPLFKNKTSIIDLAIGIMNEQEEWNYSGVPVEKTPLNPQHIKTNFVKTNTYLKITKNISKNVVFVFMNFLQTRPNKNYKNFRYSSSLQCTLKLSRKIDFAFEFNSIYDRQPIVPIKNFYYDLTNGLVIRW